MKDNNIWRPAILTAIIIAVLVGLFYVPIFEYGDFRMRRINMLSEIQCKDSAGNIIAELELDKRDGIAPVDSVEILVEDVAYKDSIPEGMIAIEDFGNGAREMDKFYKALSEADQRVVRVCYFGDSFLEGDIITQDLRELLQAEYGGSGVGFVDIDCISTGFRQSVRANRTNWEEHAATFCKLPFDQALEGINGRYFYALGDATFEAICQNKPAFPHAGKASEASVFFLPGSTLNIKGCLNDTIRQDMYVAGQSSGQDIISCSMKGDFTKFSMNVSGATGSRFFGVALDGKTGVVVDNMSLRGNAGYNLKGIPDKTLKDFAKIRPYDLIVIQYGLSVASPKVQTYTKYYDNMKVIIDKLKAAYPDAAILLHSVSDREQRSANGMVTYGGIKDLMKYQKKLAADEHIAFWSLFDGMGGEGGIAKMASQGEAAKDYTHLNFKGGKRIATTIFEVWKTGKENFDRRFSMQKVRKDQQ